MRREGSEIFKRRSRGLGQFAVVALGVVVVVIAVVAARSRWNSASSTPTPRLENANENSPGAKRSLGSSSINRGAADAYIKGRYYWNERRIPSLLRAVQLFGDALHADPTFALAYSGMGDAYVQLGYTNGLAPRDAFPKARSAATRAWASIRP